MRRREKQIEEMETIQSIMGQCQVMRLGLSDQDQPYVVPLSYGYDGASIYFHGAPKGMKADMIARNPRCCFEIEKDVAVKAHPETPCKWAFAFQSVIGFGQIRLCESQADKIYGLEVIMRQFSDKQWQFSDKQVAVTAVWKIEIESMTCKSGETPQN